MSDMVEPLGRQPDRLPRWLASVGLVAAPGVGYLAIRLVYEQTILTWRHGPQMVGFALAHSGLILPLLLSVLVLLLWSGAVLVRSFWVLSRGKSVPPLRWVGLVTAVAFMLVLVVPYGTWQRLSAGRLATGPHAMEFFTHAAATGDLTLVERFLHHGIDVNAQNADGSTALYGAAVEGQVQVIEYLLERGADVNLRNKWGHSPLHAAREMNRGSTISVLLAHGAIE